MTFFVLSSFEFAFLPQIVFLHQVSVAFHQADLTSYDFICSCFSFFLFSDFSSNIPLSTAFVSFHFSVHPHRLPLRTVSLNAWSLSL